MEYNWMNEDEKNEQRTQKAILLMQPERSHAQPKHSLYSTI